jgi:FMN-dependent NADH-azoreductase
VIKELKENSSWARVVEIKQLEEVVIEKFGSNDEHLKLLGDRIGKLEEKILNETTRLKDQLDDKEEKYFDYVNEQINELKGPAARGNGPQAGRE